VAIERFVIGKAGTGDIWATSARRAIVEMPMLDKFVRAREEPNSSAVVSQTSGGEKSWSVFTHAVVEGTGAYVDPENGLIRLLVRP